MYKKLYTNTISLVTLQKVINENNSSILYAIYIIGVQKFSFVILNFLHIAVVSFSHKEVVLRVNTETIDAV